jgi:hypothetical protein
MILALVFHMRASTTIAILLDMLETVHPLQDEAVHINCGYCNEMRRAYEQLHKLVREEK